jgi:hypothetical protein
VGREELIMFRSKNLLLGKVIVFGMLVAFSACTPGKQAIPNVVGNTIYFLDGETRIEMGEWDSFHIFAEQDRLVVISRQWPTIIVLVSFFNFNGELITKTEIRGEFKFIFAETADRVIAGGVLSAFTESYLFDLDGNVVNVLRYDIESKDIGITDDEKYFWFVGNDLRPLRPGEEPMFPGWSTTPYNRIMVFDTNTGELIESFATDESNFDFVINGKQYSIVTSPPDMPG